ncbi:hypothetical protein Taro_050185, partial [Colocasia esculenta]|nr:hypothetical protein [Colocasia esculenta]
NLAAERRHLNDQARSTLHLRQSSSEQCRAYGYLLSYMWADDVSVREVLGIHKGSIGNWMRCSNILNYSVNVTSVLPYHLSLTSGGYQALVYRFTRTYSNNLTFATVKGGGHTAPEYRPKECLAMLDRWMSGSPL